MKQPPPLVEWPSQGITRTPYQLMSDPAVYAAEQQRIFRGPVWHYLCLEAEIAEPGCYRTTHIGDTPVIVTRDKQGEVNALVNRCAHKGSLLCLDAGGKANNLSCLYHAWNYDLTGELRSVPFETGINGQGGMPASFNRAKHGLERLRVAIFYGLVFGTFSSDTETLDAYLGPAMTAQIRRVFHKPVEVLGYYHQAMDNNWKLYMENARDSYHATILHAFYTTFKLNRLTMEGGLVVEHGGWHTMNYSKGATLKQDADGAYEGSGMRAVMEDVGLAGASLLDRRQEFDDGVTVAIQSIFPTLVHQQIYNTLAVRQMVPQGPDHCELHWTFFGYQDDDVELRNMRLTQANLIGPAGYVSMEDGAIGEFVQRGIAGSGASGSALIQMGGSEVASVTGSRANETTVRGFWQGYRDVMGL